jgi:hypothetical protein
MKANPKTLRVLSILFLSLGVLAGMFLALAAAWPDLEATYYGFGRLSDDPLTTLRCPVLMTTSDTGVIRISLSNHSPVAANAKVQVFVSSSRGPARFIETMVPLAPGATERVQWEVTSADIDFRNLILAKVLAYPYVTVPVREGWCGILVLDLPFLTGTQLFALLLALSIVGMLLGIGLWTIGARPLIGKTLNSMRAMLWLAGLVLADMLIGFMGIWLVGLVLFVAAVLLILGILTSIAIAS